MQHSRTMILGAADCYVLLILCVHACWAAQVRRPVLPIAFRKGLAAAISRGATAAPEPQSGF
jgi:hypothetical protein